MSCDKGFKIKINNHEDHVVCEFADFAKNFKSPSANMALEVRVYKDGKQTPIKELDSYAKEKISDFVENAINGQSSCYWDFHGLNSHLENRRKNVSRAKKSDKKLAAFFENVEKTTGLSKETIIKALTKGVWVKWGERIEHTHWCIGLTFNGDGGRKAKTSISLNYQWGDNYPPYRDSLRPEEYGEKWALTKKELKRK